MPTVISELKKSEFPPSLLEIPEPPEKLYIQGTLPDPNQFTYLTVVGSRAASEYGRETCGRLIQGLAGLPVCIVSGLAIGIDGTAHRAALKVKMPTVAIPGSGLDERVLYPGAHRALACEIVAHGGALLSEFEPTFRATTWSFPQRNRLMAGIAKTTLVIEAKRPSGTLITSKLSGEYNRDVLAVPGSIFSKLSEGPNWLISQGARLIASSDDLRDALGFEKSAEASGEMKDTSDCSNEELALLTLLDTPTPRDEILRLAKMPIGKTSALLSLLEIKGLIRETIGEIHRL